jgi:hypothetical protein
LRVAVPKYRRGVRTVPTEISGDAVSLYVFGCCDRGGLVPVEVAVGDHHDVDTGPVDISI